jgi:hypothetical protein
MAGKVGWVGERGGVPVGSSGYGHWTWPRRTIAEARRIAVTFCLEAEVDRYSVSGQQTGRKTHNNNSVQCSECTYYWGLL